MSAWIVSLAAWLIDFSLLATAVVAAAIGVRWCFRDPAPRVALVWGTWLGLAALALVTAVPQWPRIPLPWNAGPTRLTTIVSSESLLLPPADSAASETSLPPAALSDSLPPSATIHPAAGLRWRDCLALSWLAAAGLTASWILAGLWQTWRLVRRSTAAPPWIAAELTSIIGCTAKPPGVRMSQRLTSAAAVGAFRPRILLPESAAEKAQRPIVRAALAHEWAHIGRGDLWLLALERLLLPLLAWQPLFWWLRRSVRLDLELLADAAAAGDEPLEYAEALLAWGKTDQPAPAGLAALSLWESPHTLSRRVTMLLDPKRPLTPHTSRAWQLLLVLASLALVAGLSPITLRTDRVEGQDGSATTPKPAVVGAVGYPGAKSPQLIAMALVVLEANREDLVELLPADRPQPDAQTDVSIRTPEAWTAALKILKARPGTTLIYQPQIQNLDGVEVMIDGDRAAAALARENTGLVKPEDVIRAERLAGMSVRLTPKLILADDRSKQVEIAIGAAWKDQQESNAGAGDRSLKTMVLVPDGRTAIITNRGATEKSRPLVLSITAWVVNGEDDETTAARKLAQARSDDLQKVVRQLERQLAERTAEAQLQRDQSEALGKQVAELKAQLDKLTAAVPVQTIIRLETMSCIDAERTIRQAFSEAKSLGADPQIDSIRVQADSKTNSLIVVAQPRHLEAIKAIIARLDEPTAGQTPPRSRSQGAGQRVAVPPAEADNPPTTDPLVAKGLITQRQAMQRQQAEESARVERETQVQLLKLDLQEAEISLAAARKDLQRIQALQANNAVSQEEVAKHEFQAQSAEIKVMRAKIMLEGAMRQLPPPAAKDPAAVPAPTSRLPR